MTLRAQIGWEKKDWKAIEWKKNGTIIICVYVNLLLLHHGIIIVPVAPFYFISTPPPKRGAAKVTCDWLALSASFDIFSGVLQEKNNVS